ncbi:hypothetical protein MTO96_043231 [Rhipicephalus appendiculatus]
MGATHDGFAAPEYLTKSPGAEKCPGNDNHIMTTVPPGGMLSLSTCTLEQVLAFVKSNRGQCLLNSEPRKMTLLTETNLRNPLEDGEKHCKKVYKEATFVELVANYSDDFNLENCILVCATTNNAGEKSYNIIAAPEYTFCGMSDDVPQACISGICRAVPATPKPFQQWMNEQFELKSAVINK